ncbi:MAG: FHA domain-containing serine/threonine-protein kinase [Candidatus Promineifilaceae bacterium]|jgi:serine/threonine protein kinase
MAEDLTDHVLGHYRLEELIGRGGMGSVYRALDLNLARPVALKVMDEELSARPDFQEQLQQEAQTAARLDHPSIVHIYDSGLDQQSPYIVMELVPGLSLGTYINQLAASAKVIRLDETLLLTTQVAEALGYAHRKGVLHLDIKPDNILVKESDQGERPDEPLLRAVLTDFGLAKLKRGDIVLNDGEVVGTLDYMSPEQLLGQPVDGRSDLYSLGVVLFQLATGKLPFQIETLADAIQDHVHEPPPIPLEVYPGMPASLSPVILKAMAKQPDDRYQSGEEMAQALRPIAEEVTETGTDPTGELDQNSVASMVLALDEDPNLADTSRWIGSDQALPPIYDVLRVAQEGQEPEWYGLQKRSFTLGRSEGNDIVLVGGNVSRWHARLEYINAAWYIIDTGSTNGTYLDRTRLETEKAYPWRWGQVAHIGPFDLHLQPGTGSRERVLPESDPDFMNDAYMETIPPPGIPLAPPPEIITADLRPKELKQMGICRVMIINDGHASTPVTVAVGDPSSRLMVDTPTKQVTIGSDQKGIVDFYLEGHRPFIGRRHAYPFTMHISTDKREWAVLTGNVKVKPVISIWLILFILMLILAMSILTVRFINGELPWTPQSLFEAIMTFLQGL